MHITAVSSGFSIQCTRTNDRAWNIIPEAPRKTQVVYRYLLIIHIYYFYCPYLIFSPQGLTYPLLLAMSVTF